MRKRRACIALGFLLALSLCAFACGSPPRTEAVQRLSDRLEDFGGPSSHVALTAPVSFERAQRYLEKAARELRDGENLQAERFAHLGLIQLDMALVLAEQMALEEELEKRCAASSLLEKRLRSLEERTKTSRDDSPARKPFVCPTAE